MNINGYTLKAVKSMKTPDGISYSGNIYFSNKKIGTAYNSGNGGMTEVHLSREYNEHYPVLNENFVERLFTLHDYEKIYKDEMKKHPNMVIVFVTYTEPFDLRYLLFQQEKTTEEVYANIQKIGTEGKIESVEVFRSLKDFDIIESAPESEHKPGIFKNMSDWIIWIDYNGAERFKDGSRPLIAETELADIVISGILNKNEVLIGVYRNNEAGDFYEGNAVSKESAVKIGTSIAEFITVNTDAQFSDESFNEFFMSLNITNIRTQIMG